MTTAQKEQGKRGPLPGPETVTATVLLEPELKEWGKRKPGGLSEFVRRLLREAYEREAQEAAGKI